MGAMPWPALVGWPAGFALLVLGLLAAGMSGAESGLIASLCLPIAVAGVVPATAGRWRRGDTVAAWRREAATLAAPMLPALFGGMLAGAGIAGGAALAVVIGALAMLAGGLRALLGGGDPDRPGAQSLASLTLVVLIGGIFAADPVVEKLRDDAPTRQAVISVVAGWNPVLVSAGRIFDIDLMHADLMYSRLSVIARYYRFELPGWPAAAAAYALVGVFAGGAGMMLRNRTSGA